MLKHFAPKKVSFMMLKETFKTVEAMKIRAKFVGEMNHKTVESPAPRETNLFMIFKTEDANIRNPMTPRLEFVLQTSREHNR